MAALCGNPQERSSLPMGTPGTTPGAQNGPSVELGGDESVAMNCAILTPWPPCVLRNTPRKRSRQEEPANPRRGVEEPPSPGWGAEESASPGWGAEEPASPGRGAKELASPKWGAEELASPGRGAEESASPGRGAEESASPGRGASRNTVHFVWFVLVEHSNTAARRDQSSRPRKNAVMSSFNSW